IARETRSLPTPLSPRNSTAASVTAILSTMPRIVHIAGLPLRRGAKSVRYRAGNGVGSAAASLSGMLSSVTGIFSARDPSFSDQSTGHQLDIQTDIHQTADATACRVQGPYGSSGPGLWHLRGLLVILKKWAQPWHDEAGGHREDQSLKS